MIDWKSRGIWFCKTCRKPGISALLTGLLQCVSLYFVLLHLTTLSVDVP